MLADCFTTVLFPAVDMIVEMHSGGSGSWIAPCSHMCAVDDPAQRRAMLEAMEAWNSDIHFLYTAGDNYFPTIAQAQGKTIVTTELGGSGLIPRAVHELAWSGLTNVLRHFGVLEGEVVTRTSLGLPPARIYDARGADETVTELGSGLIDQSRAPVSGIAEALVDAGRDGRARTADRAHLGVPDAPDALAGRRPGGADGSPPRASRAPASSRRGRASRSSASRSRARRCWRRGRMSHPVSCTIDLTAPGKQIGHLAFPKITNTAGWASTFVHIASIANGDGPTVLVLAGNHGDEYEGQVAALRLLQELRARAGHGPRDRDPGALPGGVEGEHAQLAVGRQLQPLVPRPTRTARRTSSSPTISRDSSFPLADVVIDMHSGGRSAWFLPCSHMHVVDDPVQRKAMLEGMEAWCSDWHYLYIDVNGHGLLPVEAENQGKLVITTELGGGGRVPAPVHRLAWSGLNNVLRHVGVLEGRGADARLARPAARGHPRRPQSRTRSWSRPRTGCSRGCSSPATRSPPASPSGGSGSSTGPDRPAELLLLARRRVRRRDEGDPGHRAGRLASSSSARRSTARPSCRARGVER